LEKIKNNNLELYSKHILVWTLASRKVAFEPGNILCFLTWNLNSIVIMLKEASLKCNLFPKANL